MLSSERWLHLDSLPKGSSTKEGRTASPVGAKNRLQASTLPPVKGYEVKERVLKQKLLLITGKTSKKQ